MPHDVGLGPLAPCPDTPNCVSSEAPADDRAHVAPIAFVGEPEVAWAAATEIVQHWPRTRIVASKPGAIHAEVKSAVFRFVDDFELRLDEAGQRIDVRSASRVGRSDLGVNRKRVEKLRAAMVARGLARAAGSEPATEPSGSGEVGP